MNKEEYALYLQGADWRSRRNECLERYASRCQICGCTPWRRTIEVHHLHYKNVGHESIDDLVPLCFKHHLLIHTKEKYDLEMLKKLRKECEEDNWEDPDPSFFTERVFSTDKGKQMTSCSQCFSSYDSNSESGACPVCGLGSSMKGSQRPLEFKDSWNSLTSILQKNYSKKL